MKISVGILTEFLSKASNSSIFLSLRRDYKKIIIALITIQFTVAVFAYSEVIKKPSSTRTKKSSSEITAPLEESFEFKGIALGSDISQFKNDKSYQCRNNNTPTADVICRSPGTTIAEKPADINLFFYSDKLYSIHIIITEEYFNDVVDALQKKYGKSEKSIETVSNRMGAKFENVTYTWERKKALLRATRYSAYLNTSAVSFSLKDSEMEYNKRIQNQAKEKSKDL